VARILTIEDDDVLRRLLAAQLELRGHQMLEAASGDEGLRVARSKLPDVILLDLGLPGVHGTVVLQRLKQDPLTWDIPVIIVSAWGEGHAALMATRRGAAGILRKPYEVEDLYAEVDSALLGVRPAAAARRP
jgi:two-component system, OmpR family, phosphate regulon response regulator PhoB